MRNTPKMIICWRIKLPFDRCKPAGVFAEIRIVWFHFSFGGGGGTITLCNTDSLRTHCLAKACLKLKYPIAFGSQLLGLKACTTTFSEDFDIITHKSSNGLVSRWHYWEVVETLEVGYLQKVGHRGWVSEGYLPFSPLIYFSLLSKSGADLLH